jgi:predicted kinase
MKQKRLWLMCGIPGSGKSTWAKHKVEQTGGVWISRDAIRFSILKDDEDYFSHEDEVLAKFFGDIQEQLNNPMAEDIIIDASHLSAKARQATLGRLNLTNASEVNCVVLDVPINTALERNEQRTGRAVVPRSVIRRMYFQKAFPTADEKFTHIIRVDENGEESEVSL